MNNMIVGSIRTTVTPPLASGIYEALLEKAERERDEAIQERERWRMQAEEKWGMRRELEELLGVKDTQSDKQFAKGLAALRVLIQERDHYKQAIEEISVTIQDWLDSIVQEPSLDFIKAIKAWADKKLKEI
jgi:vacuolar-type H+-ATPase subunit E/Vma4